MIVTINTDASFSNTFKRGSYAFWIISNSGKIAKSGILKQAVGRPEQAEFMCIINAIHTLIVQDWKNIEKVVINTDCLNVIHIIKDCKYSIEKYKLKKWGNHLKSRMVKILLNSSLAKTPFEFRHVRAHQEIQSSKQYVNDWCDKEAKLAMNRFIKEMKTKP